MPSDTHTLAVGDTVTYIGNAGDNLPYPGQRGVIGKFIFNEDGTSNYVVTLSDNRVFSLPFYNWELFTDSGSNTGSNWLGILIGGLVIAGGVGAYVWYKHKDNIRHVEKPVKTVIKNPLPYLPPDVEDYVTLHFKMMPHHIRYARTAVRDVADRTAKSLRYRSKK